LARPNTTATFPFRSIIRSLELPRGLGYQQRKAWSDSYQKIES
jgi:hypothetical protein